MGVDDGRRITGSAHWGGSSGGALRHPFHSGSTGGSGTSVNPYGLSSTEADTEFRSVQAKALASLRL